MTLFGEPGPAPPERTPSSPKNDGMASTPGMWSPQLRFGVVSTVGNVREHNEDNFYVPGRAPVQRVYAGGGEFLGNMEPTVDIAPLPGPSDLFVVADGMGGQLAGEEASKLAVETIPLQVAKRLNDQGGDQKVIVEVLREAVAKANEDILSLSSVGSEYSNMGTTVVLVLFRKNRAYVAGIGDSRAYRLRNGQLEQLTKDHSLADALGEAGTISKEQVKNHKFKHVLYLYLGSKDAREGPEPKDIRVLDLRAGDRFLLASDGLTGVVEDQQIAEMLGAIDDPQQAAQALVNQALTNLSKDNVTSVVIHVS